MKSLQIGWSVKLFNSVHLWKKHHPHLLSQFHEHVVWEKALLLQVVKLEVNYVHSTICCNHKILCVNMILGDKHKHSRTYVCKLGDNNLVSICFDEQKSKKFKYCVVLSLIFQLFVGLSFDCAIAKYQSYFRILGSTGIALYLTPAKHPQSMILPPPCFKVFKTLF